MKTHGFVLDDVLEAAEKCSDVSVGPLCMCATVSCSSRVESTMRHKRKQDLVKRLMCAKSTPSKSSRLPLVRRRQRYFEATEEHKVYEAWFKYGNDMYNVADRK